MQKLAIPATCLTPHPCHLKPTNQTKSIDHRLPTNVVPPKPKPRIGQGRAGLRRKPRMAPPIKLPKPLQMPVAPKPTLTPRTVQPLTDSEIQSQQHKPAVLLPHIQQVPASPKHPLETKISHGIMPPYHEPFVRPPPRPPGVPYTRDNRKNLFDEDTDRKINFEENSPFPGGHNFKNI